MSWDQILRALYIEFFHLWNPILKLAPVVARIITIFYFGSRVNSEIVDFSKFFRWTFAFPQGLVLTRGASKDNTGD